MRPRPTNRAVKHQLENTTQAGAQATAQKTVSINIRHGQTEPSHKKMVGMKHYFS